jgi:hypothetical protein
MTEELIPVRGAKGRLSTRSFLRACERFQIPVLRMNSRVLVLKRSDFDRFIACAGGRKAA